MSQIRALALGLLFFEGHLFVFEGFDPVKANHFYRPVGGGIDFGEPGEVALAREFREELGAELCDIRYAATVENIFTYKGRPGHEIIRLYQARFVDPEWYAFKAFTGHEDSGKPFSAGWYPLSEIYRGRYRLVPESLLPLLPDLAAAAI
jgi:8-oxo-dGTP pyrophosphatase MutT (NUDIX family)